MRRFAFLLLLIASACAGAKRTVDVQGILDRWADAIGGHAALARITSTYTRAEYEGSSGHGIVEEWATNEGARRQVNRVDGRERIHVFDGSRGWTNERGPVRPLSTREVEVERTPAYLGSFAHFFPERGAASIEYAGLDPSGKLHVLRIRPARARVTTMYIDRSTFLPVRHVQQLVNAELILDFDGWTRVDGILLPKQLILSTADGAYRATETLLEARTNLRLESEMFARPPDAAPSHRLTGTSPAVIPFTEERGQFWIKGHIGDSAPMTIAVDTGAAVTVLDARVARELGLKVERSGGLGGAGGVVESGVVSSVALRLPGVELDDVRLQVIDLAPIAMHAGEPMAMILGYDLFSRFVVELDYDAGEMRVHDSDTYAAPPHMTPIPLEIEGNHPYVAATATVGGERLSGSFVIDSGSGNSVIFTPEVVRERKLLSRVSRTLHSVAGGVGGRMEMHLARIDDISLGPITLPAPIALLPSAGEFASSGSTGNLGGALLRRFRVVFDYPRSRMLLAPSRNFDAPDEIDMTGLTLAAEGDSPIVRVVRVREGSPASEAAIAAGDEILSIDGVPAAAMGLRALRAAFRQPDREVRLRIRRGGNEREVSLRTRRLI